MYLVSAVTFGFIVWAAYLGLKRIAFYGRVTPLCYIITLLVGITFEAILVVGISAGAWGIAISHLLAMYIGIGYAMNLVGDLGYYYARYRPRKHSPQSQVPAEDHPNWLEYKFRP